MKLRISVLVFLTLLVVGLDVGNAFFEEFRELSVEVGSANPYNAVMTAQWQVYVTQVLFLGYLWYTVLKDLWQQRDPEV